LRPSHTPTSFLFCPALIVDVFFFQSLFLLAPLAGLRFGILPTRFDFFEAAPAVGSSANAVRGLFISFRDVPLFFL